MQRSDSRPVSLFGVTAAGLLALILFALTNTLNHDEGQYVAATRLVAEGWRPFLDFPYLQTPLQPYVLAPLQWLAPGYLFLASRLANAVLIAGAAFLTGRLAARLSGRASTAPLAAFLLFACDSIQFAGSVARNDALPLLLFVAALDRLLGCDKPSRRRLFHAGLLLAGAASAKISYALPAAAVAFVALIRDGRSRPGTVAALLGGMALGALPTLAFLAAAPGRVWFYLVDYSIDGVRAFQQLGGTTERLGWSRRLIDLVKFAALGSLLPLLLASVCGRGRRVAPLLLAVFASALLASILPMPVYRQYLVPVAVPAILVAAANGSLSRLLDAPRGALVAILAVVLVAGSARSAIEMIGKADTRRPWSVTHDAHLAGALARKSGATNLASLDAVSAADSGVAIDRRFAPGPFLFRAGNLAACADRALCPVTFATLGALDNAPPGAILTGCETRSVGPFEQGLDEPMIAWARAHGFAPRQIGNSTLWLRPPWRPRP